ncbi:MAG: LacI family transcriptional regulator [Pelagimonas sp.]|jgi:DNA-binding LacI/PurR family transcriptional regulator|nr:LacI family transcriptional regulator [Pelagimonas sp.]
MAPKPKLENVAKTAGVSVATVSQVMRGTGRTSEKTRKKVLCAAEKLHYVPDGRASSMRSGINREIGFVVHQIASPFNAEVISGVSDLLETEGYLVSVLDSRGDSERERSNIEAFIRSSRGGLLWVPAMHTSQRVCELLAAHRIPTVTFLRPVEFADFDHVGIENEKATATEYLVDLGHTRIAYLGGHAEANVHVERVARYTAVLRKHNLAPPVVWECPDDKLSGLRGMNGLMDAHPDTTAIVCNGDMIALGASLALQRSGRQPGTGISIIGFDDIQDAVVATPALTTMSISPYQLRKKLAQVVLDRIQEPDMPYSSTLVAARLAIRETTSPPNSPSA